MKVNKITLLSSSIAMIVTITLYSLCGYAECLKNVWVKDVSLACCGSAVLLIVTSIIGYATEKRRTQERIIKEAFSFFMTSGLSLVYTSLSLGLSELPI